VDHERERFVMFFHIPSGVDGGFNLQMTFAATCRDGLNFNGRIRPVRLGNGYFRTFVVRGQGYAIANGGRLWRAPEGALPWDEAALSPPEDPDFHFGRQTLWEEAGRAPFMAHAPAEFGLGGEHDAVIRHSGVRLVDQSLHLFYTVKRGDPPERILVAKIDVSGDWKQWKATSVGEVLRPEKKWEGAEEPLERSKKGGAHGVRQLRDPYVLEADGRIYLYYSGSGEGGIGVAELRPADETP
jgi:hypothetical protein